MRIVVVEGSCSNNSQQRRQRDSCVLLRANYSNFQILTAQITEIRNLNDPICLRDSEISFGVACHGQFVTHSNVTCTQAPLCALSLHLRICRQISIKGSWSSY
jgi:hypothetical protein